MVPYLLELALGVGLRCAWLALPCGPLPWPRLTLLALAIAPSREVSCGQKLALACGHMPWPRPRLPLLALAIVPPMEVNCGQTFDTAVGSGALYWPFSRAREVNRGHFQPNGG